MLQEFIRTRMANRALYHFTDERNLESIKREGGLLSHAELRRRKISVTAPGGNEHSHDADARFGVDDDVHLCFCDQHPMEYKAKNSGHLGSVRWIRVNPKVMTQPGVRFTVEVANKAGAELMSFEEAHALYDMDALFGRLDWKDSSEMARVTAARKYEVLVPKFIPLAQLRNY